MKNEKTTIDKLAQITATQFSKVDERFDAMDERFNKMEDTLEKMNGTLKTVLDVVLDIPSKKAFGRLETTVESIDARLMAA